MSAIGAYTFLQMTGPQVPARAAAVEVIERPGVDGSAFREEAQKVPELILNTLAAATTLAAANLACDNYALLKGTLVTVVDQLGRTVPYVMVLDVRVTRVAPCAGSAPVGTNYLVWAQWWVKPTQ